MEGSFDPPETLGEMTRITGTAPVALMREYHSQVSVYTKGRGRLACRVKGYESCHNTQEVIEASGYDSEADTDNPTGSIFCSHGSGFYVPWDQVTGYMHLPSCLGKRRKEAEREAQPVPKNVPDISWEDEKNWRKFLSVPTGRFAGLHGGCPTVAGKPEPLVIRAAHRKRKMKKSCLTSQRNIFWWMV